MKNGKSVSRKITKIINRKKYKNVLFTFSHLTSKIIVLFNLNCTHTLSYTYYYEPIALLLFLLFCFWVKKYMTNYYSLHLINFVFRITENE